MLVRPCPRGGRLLREAQTEQQMARQHSATAPPTAYRIIGDSQNGVSGAAGGSGGGGGGGD